MICVFYDVKWVTLARLYRSAAEKARWMESQRGVYEMHTIATCIHIGLQDTVGVEQCEEYMMLDTWL